MMIMIVQKEAIEAAIEKITEWEDKAASVLQPGAMGEAVIDN
jgi:hypothetical protein